MAPADLMDHECIRARYSSGALYRWEFERHGEAMRIDVPGSLTLDEPEMIAQASRAGIGLAYIGEWMVADDIASGRLVEVLSEWTPSYPGYCLYYPGRRHMAASLRAFVDLAREIVFLSFAIARRRLDRHRTGWSDRGACAATGSADGRIGMLGRVTRWALARHPSVA